MIRKLDRNGIPLLHQNIPMRDLPTGTKAEDLPQENIWFFVGPNGRLRASHREICQEQLENLSLEEYRERMSDAYVYHPHDKRSPLKAGEIVELEISLWPGGIVFDAEESLRLDVKGRHPILPEFNGLEKKIMNHNVGKHTLHTGGAMASFLYVSLKQ